jgi:membrane-associated protein
VGFIKNNIDAVLVVIVLVSVLPMVFEAWRARRNRPVVAADEAADA